MATLSTLELMLHEIQNRENLEHFVDHGKLPVLPQRPVSKARMPTGRARRAVLSLHLQKIGGKTKDEFVDGMMIKRDGFAFVNGGLLSSNKDHEMKNEGEEKAEKGIIVMQKYFRGYQARFHYHKLKDGIITLQSFVRGENARRKFQNSTKKLTQTTHIPQDFVWKPLRTREATIIYLQSVVRSWLNRKHIDYIEDPTIENNEEANEIQNQIMESKEKVKVSQAYIRDLEQQVLRVETALQRKKHENYVLELQIQQIDKKWELHKAKMDMKEKSWQDEFTSIQMSIASTQEETMNEITSVPQKMTTGQENGNKNITIRQILERQESGFGFGFQIDNKLNTRKGQEQELRKLKGRFKAWKKEFKTRLHHVKRTLDRFDHCRTQRVHKSCFVS